jgi:general secretion pathway protein A
MYANYWGLAEIPFRNTIDTRWFYQSQVHEEALARLLFLVENHRRCGVLSGAAGTGKSLLLEILEGEVVRTGGQVAHIDLFGRSSQEMLWEIVAELGVPAGPDDSTQRLWRKLHDHVLANRYSRAPLILLLDHLDRAQPECVGVIERLHHLSSGGDTGLTLILGVRDERGAAFAPVLREISDLRIEIAALDRTETQNYIITLLTRAGAAQSIFDDSAIDRLFDETHGVPRHLNRLCDLTLLAGMADQSLRIDESMVAAAAEELHIRLRSERSPVHFRQRFAAGV